MLVGAGLAYISFPLYDRLEKRIKNKNYRAILVMAFVFVPIIVIGWVSTIAIIDMARGEISFDLIAKAVDDVVNILLSPFGVKAQIGEDIIVAVFGFFEGYAKRAVNQSFRILAELSLFVATYIYTLTQAREDLHLIIDQIPEDTKEFIQDYHSHVAQLLDAMIFSTILTSAIIGFISFFLYWIAGFSIPISFIFAILTFLVALLPVLGSPFVFLPAASIAYSLYGLGSAMFLVISGVLLLLLLPTFVLTPLIASKYGEVNFILPLIAFIAAPIAFGGIRGFVAGPLIVSLGFATLEFLKENPQLIWGEIKNDEKKEDSSAE